MAKVNVKCKYEVKGFDIALKHLKETVNMASNINSYIEEFTRRLGDIGLQYATLSFQRAQYDGTNDVTVSIEQSRPNVLKIVARGKAVLFIEFGTGIFYPDDHPKAKELNMVRGEYGQKKGQNESWVYVGEAGTHGKVLRYSDSGKQAVRTHGNPASRSMYLTAEEVRNNIQKIAEEVFG
ncbi:MAG: hypothetical protein J6L85_08840 [Clostridia bacterium]|nr:hypothetical protein [Clostridia bacterium]